MGFVLASSVAAPALKGVPPMRRSLLTAAASVVLIAATSVPAFADSCVNVSRAAPAGWTQSTTYTAPLIQGGWVWLPSLVSIGVPADQLPPFWGKITPGTPDSINFGAPGANGNYTNGKTISLLGVSAVCNTSSQAFVIRQTTHGIQSGCQ
jgi:hypothetical protein